MVKNPSGNMSRKNGVSQIVQEQERSGTTKEKSEQTTALLAMRDEEKAQLFLVDDERLGVQVISAPCQSTPSQSKGENGQIGGAGWQGSKTEESREPLFTALLNLALVLFNLSWSVGLCWWDFQLNNLLGGVTSMVILIVSGSITSIAFFTTTSPTCRAARMELWARSKLAWLLAAIPCFAPVILAVARFLASMQRGDQRRGWRITTLNGIAAGDTTKTPISKVPSRRSPTMGESSVPFFLIESLTLSFPMCVVHLSYVLEDTDSFPAVRKVVAVLGLFLLSFSITFSRFQFDCLYRSDRFGVETEKYLRFLYLWSAKAVWIATYTVLVATAKITHPGREWEGIGIVVGGFIAIHEIPLWICLIPKCNRLAARVSGIFFLIPQFTSLMAFIYWLNMDPEVYHRDVPSIVLGVYFWANTVLLCGWLADGASDKDIDLVPLYPHFFGDLISSCFPDEDDNLLLP